MGKNYQEYFDFIIFDAGKPNFMYDHSENEFKKCFTEEKVQLFKLEDNIIQGGSLRVLNSYLEDILGKFKGIIFEDNFYCGLEEKNAHSSQHHWDYALILKEIGETEEEIDADNTLDYKKKWGSQLIGRNIKGEYVLTYFMKFINDYTDFVFSSMKSENLQKFFDVK